MCISINLINNIILLHNNNKKCIIKQMFSYLFLFFTLTLKLNIKPVDNINIRDFFYLYTIPLHRTIKYNDKLNISKCAHDTPHVEIFVLYTLFYFVV